MNKFNGIFYPLRPYLINGVYCACISMSDFTSNICFVYPREFRSHVFGNNNFDGIRCSNRGSSAQAYFHVYLEQKNESGGFITNNDDFLKVVRRASKRDKRYAELIRGLYKDAGWENHCRCRTHKSCLISSGFQYLVDKYMNKTKENE